MVKKIIVERGVPLPGKYPFDTMEVGDSFALPKDVKRTTVSVAAMRYGRERGMKFTIRNTPLGFRCWRIA